MLAKPVIDLFKKLLPPLVEIRPEFLDGIGIDLIVDCKALKSPVVGVAGHVVAQRVGMVEQVGAEEADASCVHFDRHVIATFSNVSILIVFFDRPGLKQLAKQCLFRRIATVSSEKRLKAGGFAGRLQREWLPVISDVVGVLVPAREQASRVGGFGSDCGRWCG